MEKTSARLRKTFQYPDESNTDEPEALDEEEQDSLISTLTHHNTSTNTLYQTLFLALCALCTLPYLPTLFLGPNQSTTAAPSSSTLSLRLLALLSITSLASSAYILHAFPQGSTTLRPLDALLAKLAGTRTTTTTPDDGRSRAQARPASVFEGADGGPIETYLPYLNLILVALLAVGGALVQTRGLGGREAALFPGFAVLPGGVYGIVLTVKVLLGSVDVTELDRLRYGYKGA